MSQPTSPPTNLGPQLCFNTRVLQDFLRLSRATIDDSISTNLNALLTPSTSSPFAPSSTSIRSPPSAQQRSIPSESCQTFLKSVLFPSWTTRTDLLTYCASVATSADPNDPELPSIQDYNRRGAERTVDERLDPYSGIFFPREPRTQMLAGVLRNENAVENIIRQRTWAIVQERCEGGQMGEKWEEALDKWRIANGR